MFSSSREGGASFPPPLHTSSNTLHNLTFTLILHPLSFNLDPSLYILHSSSLTLHLSGILKKSDFDYFLWSRYRGQLYTFIIWIFSALKSQTSLYKIKTMSAWNHIVCQHHEINFHSVEQWTTSNKETSLNSICIDTKLNLNK